MKILAALFTLLPLTVFADIYTKTEAADQGGLKGATDKPLTHAIAIEKDRVRVYLATLAKDGKSFQFDHLPVGRYDLALITTDGGVYEGIQLGGDASSLSKESRGHIEERLAKADNFFNKWQIYRIGLDGDHTLVLVERIRDTKTLQGSGKAVEANIHRFEIADFQQATDEWQMIGTRHFYREPDPKGTTFFQDHYLPALQNIRVIDSLKDLGNLTLQTP